MIDILPWHRDSLAGLIARGDKIPHALLVHGRSGIGKVQFARALAQSFLCESAEDGMACGKCHACGWFSNGNHPDFRELLPDALMDDEAIEDAVAESNSADVKDRKRSKEIRIEQVRGIANFMMLSTHRNGYRVLLIHPAEAMNLAAANALLKTLEEPAARSVILLVSDNVGRLIATIRSRCQRVLVPTPETAVAVAWLKSQGIVNAEAALATAGGAPLDAIDFSNADYQAARRAFVAALSEPAMDYVQTAQSFEKADLNNVLFWLHTWVNDVITKRMAGTVSHHPDQVKTISRIAGQIELARVFRFETELRQTRRLINHPLNARLLLEQLLIAYKQSIRARPILSNPTTR